MYEAKKVLAAITTPSVAARLQGLRSPVDVDFERVENGQALVALAWRRVFDLIVLELPFPSLALSDALRTLRSPASASAKAPVVLLKREGDETDLSKLPASRLALVATCTTVSQALKVVADELQLSDRCSVSLLAETERVTNSIRSRQVLQTENISTSGMLLRTSRKLPLSYVVPFTLRLPDDELPIYGRGEVVRHADYTTEGTFGVGVRFFGLDGNGSSRLSSFLGRQARPGHGLPTG